MVATIIFSITTVILFEAVGFLAYKVYKLTKELDETEDSLDNLAECVLTITKNGVPTKVEIIENNGSASSDFTFPNKEGF